MRSSRRVYGALKPTFTLQRAGNIAKACENEILRVLLSDPACPEMVEVTGVQTDTTELLVLMFGLEAGDWCTGSIAVRILITKVLHRLSNHIGVATSPSRSPAAGLCRSISISHGRLTKGLRQ